MKLSKIQIWLMAIRPKTLWAAAAPVFIGSTMAFGDGVFHLPSAVAAFFGATLIQIGTNFANDYFDFKKGVDTNERIGPTRVMQSGLVTKKEMKFALVLIFGLASLVSMYLIYRCGLPILLIAIASILSAIFYTAGPYPLGYIGLGEVFVFIFFGPIAVGGTYYVQALEINPLPVIAGIAPGLLSVAILTVNNLRDIENDRRSGKKTLAVRFGRSFAISEYYFSIFGAAAVPVVLFFTTNDYKYTTLASLIVFFAVPTIKAVSTQFDGASLNRSLATTGILLFLYSILFSIGWML